MQVREVRRRADRGAAAVETALVLPLLLMVVFAMIDFGRMLNTQIRVTEAAREGARALTLDDADGARAAATTVIGEPAADIDPEGRWRDKAHGNCLSDENHMSYQVVYEFEFITPLGIMIGAAGPGDIPLDAEAVMPCRA
ncbi:TadE family protein [Catenuloplanes sp. NPDC051500]|uniref:TadE family protein n=1 Tax=Catenuloplanes sp. NPDC051500 TaxID=3363959 RepID=UPI0037879929